MSFFLMGTAAQAQVSLIGAGATGDWNTDQDMVTTDGNIWTLVDYTMPGGEFKFRLNHAWDTAWGNSTFPNGTGDTAPGSANIIAIPGTYNITFNQTTGEYSFTGGTPIATVKLVGTAVTQAGGIGMITADAENYTASNVTLVDGTAQFQIDDVAYGSTEFPTGTVSDPVLFIPVPAGVYTSVSVNISSGEFSFVAAPVYPVISITGSAVGGWGDGFDFDMTTNDGVIYTYTGLSVAAGELKFRENNAWTVSYGDAAWPSGVATTSGGNIQVPGAGTYSVTFNRTTGEYNFYFTLVSLTGDAFGGWGDGFDFDLTTTDGVNYSINSITSVGGGGKFRLNHAWDISYGSADFPAGTATNPGDNIAVPAGTYGVTFNLTSGAFAFGDPLATASFNKGQFVVYPNPSNNNWNFSGAVKINSIQIVDMLGKTVKNVTVANNQATVDASSLNSGIYFAKINSDNATETVKVVKK